MVDDKKDPPDSADDATSVQSLPIDTVEEKLENVEATVVDDSIREKLMASQGPTKLKQEKTLRIVPEEFKPLIAPPTFQQEKTPKLDPGELPDAPTTMPLLTTNSVPTALLPVEENVWEQLNKEDEKKWESVTGQSKVERRAEKATLPPGGSPPVSAPPPQPHTKTRLLGITGEDANVEYLLNEREMTLGRASKNTIIVKDSSISREHVRFFYDGSGYVLMDLKSGNGTFVNGKRVDRVKLRHGDDIALGNAHFRFINEGESSRSRLTQPGVFRESTQPSNRLYYVLGIGAVVFAFSVIVLSVWHFNRSTRQAEFQHYSDALGAYRRHDWAAAEQSLAQWLTFRPNDPVALRYLDAIKKERKNAEDLETARRLQAAGELAQAYRLAQNITDSEFSIEARRLLRLMDSELELRTMRARDALLMGQVSEANRHLSLVEDLRPAFPNVAEIRRRLGPRPQSR